MGKGGRSQFEKRTRLRSGFSTHLDDLFDLDLLVDVYNLLDRDLQGGREKEEVSSSDADDAFFDEGRAHLDDLLDLDLLVDVYDLLDRDLQEGGKVERVSSSDANHAS